MSLRKLVITGMACLGLTSLTTCTSVPSERVPTYQVKQAPNLVLEEALGYMNQKEYAKAQGLLEQRITHLQKEYYTKLAKLKETNPLATIPFTGLGPSEQVILAMAYAHTNNLGAAERTFRNLMSNFRSTPTIVETVQYELHDYFTTKDFKTGEKRLHTFTIFNNKLYAIAGFLKLAQQDYTTTGQYLKWAAASFPDDFVNKYREAFAKLTSHSCDHNDKRATIGYAKVLGALYDAHTQPPVDTVQLNDAQQRRKELGALLKHLYKSNNQNELILDIAAMIKDTYQKKDIE